MYNFTGCHTCSLVVRALVAKTNDPGFNSQCLPGFIFLFSLVSELNTNLKSNTLYITCTKACLQ